MPFMNIFKDKFEWTKPILEMDDKNRRWYTGYWHGIAHSIFSGFGALYCFFYADGRAGTSWFDDQEY